MSQSLRQKIRSRPLCRPQCGVCGLQGVRDPCPDVLLAVSAVRDGGEVAKKTGTTTWTLAEIDGALRESWAADTCSPDDVERAPWTADNPAWGHCDITALVVQDVLGGELMAGDVMLGEEQQGYHMWNRLPSGAEQDLTRDQFRRGQRIVRARTVGPRPPGRLPRREEDYRLLRQRVAARLGAALSEWQGSAEERAGPD